MKNLTKNWN